MHCEEWKKQRPSSIPQRLLSLMLDMMHPPPKPSFSKTGGSPGEKKLTNHRPAETCFEDYRESDARHHSHAINHSELWFYSFNVHLRTSWNYLCLMLPSVLLQHNPGVDITSVKVTPLEHQGWPATRSTNKLLDIICMVTILI